MLPTPLNTPNAPTVCTPSCQQLAEHIATLEHEEIGLSAANDIAQIRLTAAREAFDSAKHLADVSERRLSRNRYKQLALHDDFNAHGC